MKKKFIHNDNNDESILTEYANNFLKGKDTKKTIYNVKTKRLVIQLAFG